MYACKVEVYKNTYLCMIIKIIVVFVTCEDAHFASPQPAVNTPEKRKEKYTEAGFFV
jgi:hypothetical protein